MHKLPSIQQLRAHPNAVVASRARLAVDLWDNLTEEQLPPGLGLDMPATELVDGLQKHCTSLPEGSAGLGTLNTVLGHLLVATRIQDLSIISSFKRLGAGSFATIYVSENRGGVVVKQVKNPADAGRLRQECEDLEIIYTSCSGPEQLFKLPQPHGCYDTYYEFAWEMGIPRDEDMGLPPHAMYVMQRVWPVPDSLTIHIRNLFFPEQFARGSYAPFVARLYLGRQQSRTVSRFFNPENFSLDLQRIQELGLPAADIARGMGRLMASINFVAGRDGRDIEFILCGNPVNPLSKEPSYSCIDFNQMRQHGGSADTIAKSILENDPYYPRPGSPYWTDFVESYVAHAQSTSDVAASLAREVVARLQSAWG